MQKIYISGMITRDPNYMAKFRDAEEILTDRNEGTYFLNPTKVPVCKPAICNPSENPDHPEVEEYKHSWACYMKYTMRAMLSCDGIVLLPDWRDSKGAQLEQYVAAACGLTVYYMDELLKI